MEKSNEAMILGALAELITERILANAKIKALAELLVKDQEAFEVMWKENVYDESKVMVGYIKRLRGEKR